MARSPKSETRENQRENSQIDVSLIDYTLKLSAEARIEAHENARRLLEDLQKAGQEHYANRSKSSADKTPGA